MLSVILPSYNEQENIERSAQALSAVLQAQGEEYEIIFVNDGSTDATWKCILDVCRRDARIKGLNFSRNFGKEAAMFAGLRECAGDCAVIMDCDLQHPPETICEMLEKWREGFEVVEGIKRSRGRENALHAGFAGLFYKTISRFTGIDMRSSSDFKLLDRKVVDALCALSEKNTFFRALSFWVGFKTARVEYDVVPRAFGETKWSPMKLVKYAINNITSFTAAPLHAVTFMGLILVFASAVLAVQTFCKWALGSSVEGFTTVILLLLLIGGFLMISLGIIGYYIAKIYEEIKNRPQYIIAERVNTDKNR